MTAVAGRAHAVAAGAFVLLLGFAWRVLTFAGFGNDHYVHLSRSQQMVFGDLPVRDFIDPGMPLLYMASAAAWTMWGGSPGTELLLVASAFGLAAVCTFGVALRLSGSVAIGLAAALVEVFIMPRTFGYPKMLVYAAAAWSIIAVAAALSRRRIWGLAGVTAVAFLFRHDHALFVGIAGAVALALVPDGVTWRAAARRLAMFAAGVVLLVSPWLAFVAYHQGIVDYFASSIAFSRAEATHNGGPLLFVPFRLSPDRLIQVRQPYRPSVIVEWKDGVPETTRQALETRYRLEPVSTDRDPPREYYTRDASSTTLQALAADPHVAGTGGFDRVSVWSPNDARRARFSPSRLQLGTGWHADWNPPVWLFHLFRLLPVACAAVVWRRWRTGRERWKGESAAIAALVVLATLVNVGFLRGDLWERVPDAVVPAVLLAAWLAPLMWSPAVSRRSVRLAARIGLTVILAVSVLAIGAVGRFTERLEQSEVGNGIAGFTARMADLQGRLWRTHRETGFPPSSVSAALLPFFDYLQRCTSRDDRLIVSHLYPDVFVMAQRGFAGGHEAYREGFYTSAVDQEQMLARLRRQSVPFVFMLRAREAEFRRNFDRLAAYVDARYEQMTALPVEERDALLVLVEKNRAAVRFDSETGWPCFR